MQSQRQRHKGLRVGIKRRTRREAGVEVQWSECPVDGLEVLVFVVVVVVVNEVFWILVPAGLKCARWMRCF